MYWADIVFNTMYSDVYLFKIDYLVYMRTGVLCAGFRHGNAIDYLIFFLSSMEFGELWLFVGNLAKRRILICIVLCAYLRK